MSKFLIGILAVFCIIGAAWLWTACDQAEAAEVTWVWTPPTGLQSGEPVPVGYITGYIVWLDDSGTVVQWGTVSDTIVSIECDVGNTVKIRVAALDIFDRPGLISEWADDHVVDPGPVTAPSTPGVVTISW